MRAPICPAAFSAARPGIHTLRSTSWRNHLAIAGRRWTMRIGRDDPQARVTVRFARPGSQRYEVTTSTLFDSGAVINGHGSGTIECTGGQTYELAGDYDQDPAQIVLQAS